MANDPQTVAHLLKAPPIRSFAKAVTPLTERLNAWWCSSYAFKRLASRAFKEADVDGNGLLNEAELYVCLLRIYDKANTYLTTHVKAPKKQDVKALLKKFDLDRSGSLSFDEFLKCAQTVMGLSNAEHSIPLNVLAVLLLRVSVLPSVAMVITATSEYIGGIAKPLTWVPVAVWTIVLEMMLRYMWAAFSPEA